MSIDHLFFVRLVSIAINEEDLYGIAITALM